MTRSEYGATRQQHHGDVRADHGDEACSVGRLEERVVEHIGIAVMFSMAGAGIDHDAAQCSPWRMQDEAVDEPFVCALRGDHGADERDIATAETSIAGAEGNGRCERRGEDLR